MNTSADDLFRRWAREHNFYWPSVAEIRDLAVAG